ncbi:MAG: hypothetical protein IH804_09820 [Planctomycetes bacterium]|nr:hypothetical protein [Planctomycetota bacterium]
MPAEAQVDRLTPRQRQVYQAMLDAGPEESMTTLAEGLGISRQRIHELIGLIQAAGVKLPPWATVRARARRRSMGVLNRPART